MIIKKPGKTNRSQNIVMSIKRMSANYDFFVNLSDLNYYEMLSIFPLIKSCNIYPNLTSFSTQASSKEVVYRHLLTNQVHNLEDAEMPCRKTASKMLRVPRCRTHYLKSNSFGKSPFLLDAILLCFFFSLISFLCAAPFGKSLGQDVGWSKNDALLCVRIAIDPFLTNQLLHLEKKKLKKKLEGSLLLLLQLSTEIHGPEIRQDQRVRIRKQNGKFRIFIRDYKAKTTMNSDFLFSICRYSNKQNLNVTIVIKNAFTVPFQNIKVISNCWEDKVSNSAKVLSLDLTRVSIHLNINTYKEIWEIWIAIWVCKEKLDHHKRLGNKCERALFSGTYFLLQDCHSSSDF